jgi:hypothetical protein
MGAKYSIRERAEKDSGLVSDKTELSPRGTPGK